MENTCRRYGRQLGTGKTILQQAVQNQKNPNLFSPPKIYSPPLPGPLPILAASLGASAAESAPALLSHHRHLSPDANRLRR